MSNSDIKRFAGTALRSYLVNFSSPLFYAGGGALSGFAPLK